MLAFALASVPVFVTHAAVVRCESLWTDHRLRSDIHIAIPDQKSGPGFIVPNEHRLGLEKASFAQISEGIYLTVGTERGLMSSALAAGKIKALVQVDRDEKVVLFNLINRGLLASSRSREHYLHLRLKSSHEEWMVAVRQAKSLSDEDRHTLARFEVWQWWQQQVQSFKAWDKFHRPSELNPDKEYAGANYLFDDSLFSSVRDLARQQRIYIVHDSLGTETFRQRVVGISEGLKLKLAAVDMSNAWQEGYLGHENTLLFLESLKPQMEPETKLIFTFLTRAESYLMTSSIFKYFFTSVVQDKDMRELALSLVNMARSEPSKNPQPRSRVHRYESF